MERLVLIFTSVRALRRLLNERVNENAMIEDLIGWFCVGSFNEAFINHVAECIFKKLNLYIS